MNVLAWNCRGTGRHRTMNNMRDLNHKYRTSVTFLMETKQGSTYLNHHRISLDYANSFYVDPINLSGGLVLWWDNGVSIRVLSFSKNFIHAVLDLNRELYCTFLYVPCSLVDRMDVWEDISNLRRSTYEPWMVIGDYNAVCYSPTNTFRDFIAHNELIDLRFEGDPFTWYNRQNGDDQIKERLDRALVNTFWRIHFSRALLFHESKIGSDHKPLRLSDDTRIIVIIIQN
ncbi:hypothetical protein LINPERHAP2_LOCUS19854 [Linum perenne]